jgi:hypothetical protein
MKLQYKYSKKNVMTDTCDKMIQNWLIMSAASKIYTHLIKLIFIDISIVKPANTDYS